jgi:hypothetical protein
MRGSCVKVDRLLLKSLGLPCGLSAAFGLPLAAAATAPVGLDKLPQPAPAAGNSPGSDAVPIPPPAAAAAASAAAVMEGSVAAGAVLLMLGILLRCCCCC